MPASYPIYVDGIQYGSTTMSTQTLTITATGWSSTDMGSNYTYSGSGTFLGVSTTSGATTPDTGLAVGDTFYPYNYRVNGEVRLYSVATAAGGVVISYDGDTIATLDQAGMTAELHTASTYCFEDIIIEATLGAGDQMTASWDYMGEGTFITGTSSGIYTLRTGGMYVPDDITISYLQGVDLTGTTWFFPSSYTDMDGPWDDTTWNVNFTSNGTNYTALNTDMWNLYYGSTFAFGPASGAPAWTNNNYRTIVITGGTDVTSATLYAWLSANATQTGGSLISFSIAGITYCAESGMTWTQWVNSGASGYNTYYFSIASASGKLPTRVTKSGWEPGECVAVSSSTICAPTDTIVADTAYIKGNAAGGPVISL